MPNMQFEGWTPLGLITLLILKLLFVYLYEKIDTRKIEH
jgi:hypothetical protein